MYSVFHHPLHELLDLVMHINNILNATGYHPVFCRGYNLPLNRNGYFVFRFCVHVMSSFPVNSKLSSDARYGKFLQVLGSLGAGGSSSSISSIQFSISRRVVLLI